MKVIKTAVSAYEVTKELLKIEEAQLKEKMMPGQEPYTPEEKKKLRELIEDAAKGDPGELAEEEVIERVKGEDMEIPNAGDVITKEEVGEIGEPSTGEHTTESNRPSLKEIYRTQSHMFIDDRASDLQEDFILKALDAGYGKAEIIEALREFFRIAYGEEKFDKTMDLVHKWRALARVGLKKESQTLNLEGKPILSPAEKALGIRPSEEIGDEDLLKQLKEKDEEIAELKRKLRFVERWAEMHGTSIPSGAVGGPY